MVGSLLEVRVIELRVPGNLAYRNIALRAVSEACKMAQLVGTGSWDELELHVVSAVGEAFNNVAIHSYRGREPGIIALTIDWSPDEVVVEIADSGNSFDPQAVEVPDLDLLPECGMGLYIMRSFMDRVEYRAGSPNVLRLTKLRVEAPDLDAGRSSGVHGLASELEQGGVLLNTMPGGEDSSTSRSDWRIKAVDPAGATSRVGGGSRRG